MRSLKELMNLRGRVALVTGGAGHIGRAFCSALAERGARVVVIDVVANRCRETAAQIRGRYKVAALPLVADLADERQVKAVAPKVLREFGRIDILVNTAAMVGTSSLKGWAVPFAQQRADSWRQALEVNLTAAFLLTQACAPALGRSGRGSVINVGSIYGLVGPDLGLYEGTSMGNPAAYAASKGGLFAMTRWLATVLAPKVRVNAVTPGGVLRDQPAPFRRRYTARVPLKRMATEEDLKGAVAFLASDLSAYVTGHNLVVDGGWTAW
jgi:NAD(P)-dependent dehydrogenase (short-subunit alcohol dehydrogenase family)